MVMKEQPNDRASDMLQGLIIDRWVAAAASID